MITLIDKPSTYISYKSQYNFALEQPPLFDKNGFVTYVSLPSQFIATTSKKRNDMYINIKEDLSFSNHIELYGHDAQNFDQVMKNFNEPNDLMKQLLKDVYDNRMFE